MEARIVVGDRSRSREAQGRTRKEYQSNSHSLKHDRVVVGCCSVVVEGKLKLDASRASRFAFCTKPLPSISSVSSFLFATLPSPLQHRQIAQVSSLKTPKDNAQQHRVFVTATYDQNGIAYTAFTEAICCLHQYIQSSSTFYTSVSRRTLHCSSIGSANKSHPSGSALQSAAFVVLSHIALRLESGNKESGTWNLCKWGNIRTTNQGPPGVVLSIRRPKTRLADLAVRLSFCWYMYFNNVSTFIYSTVSTRSSVQQLIGAAEARRAHNPEDARSKRASATCFHYFLFGLFADTAFVKDPWTGFGFGVRCQAR
jgi:hypothetical protein